MFAGDARATPLSRHSTSGKRHLPQPRGPHSVGYADVMTPGDPNTGTFIRIYYPTSEQCLEKHERWPVWAEDHYITGFLTFMQVSTRVTLQKWNENYFFNLCRPCCTVGQAGPREASISISTKCATYLPGCQSSGSPPYFVCLTGKCLFP